MPELPEVQTIVNDLKKDHLIGASIAKAEVFWAKTIDTLAQKDFCSQISGTIILDIYRRGKYIVLSLTGKTLLIHLRMSGRFTLESPKKAEIEPHERVRLYLNDGRILVFEDPRKFGRLYLLEHPEEKLDKLGVDPLSEPFTLAYLIDAFKKRSVKIKALLLNQQILSGIGNIYADEALFKAKIHPEKRANKLSKNEIKALHVSIREVLELGVLHGGTSLGTSRANFHSATGKRGENLPNLLVYQRERLPCSECRNPIMKITSGGRGTHFCPHCQKKGRD